MSTRAWFRLDEVHPVAEHAMACASHRLTTAQVRAGFPLRPALIWTAATDEQDAVSSNGIPAWYDDDGEDHAATAWTWTHRPTGRRGTPARHDFDTAYLPLNQPTDRSRGRFPVIDLLRDGRNAAAHWVVIDIGADTPLIRPDAVRLVDHRDDIAPADARWTPATVTAAAVAHGIYPALIADGYTIRGDDVLARFDRATTEQIAADLSVANTDSMPGEFPVLRFDGDVLLVLWEHDDGLQIRQREIDRVYPDPGGFYSAGAYLWPWTPAGN
jgi:hypothetical protein